MRNILIGSTLILAAALSRLLPHPDNFTPIAAMALAGGVYLEKRFALIIPLAALVISDFFIGFHHSKCHGYNRVRCDSSAHTRAKSLLSTFSRSDRRGCKLFL